MSKMDRSKSRLGRGLSSLINVSEDLAPPANVPPNAAPADLVASVAPTAAAGTPAKIPLDQIVPNPHQPRRTFDEQSIAALAASLKANGLIQPIIVRRVDDQYQLIAGERRWRAAQVAGLVELPAVVLDIDAFTQAQMALVENIQREDLNPVDRALGYRLLMDQLGLTQAELATRLGEDRSSIANYLRVLDLSTMVQSRVREGQLSLGHAKLLAGVPDILEQQRLAVLTIAQGLSVRNLERLLLTGTMPPLPRDPSPPAQSPAYQQDLEKNLSRQLGLRVQVRSGKKKGRGRLVLHYNSLDQFDQLINKLGVKLD